MVVFAVVAETQNVLAWFRSERHAKKFRDENSKRPEAVFRAVAIVPMVLPEKFCDVRNYFVDPIAGGAHGLH